MKSRSMFHILAVLTIVLTFSMPFATPAQQKFVQTEVSEVAAAQDANAVNLDPKAAAEQDASNDINESLWFSVGLGILYVAGGTGVLAGDIVSEKIFTSPDPIIPDGPDLGGTVGFLVGATAGVLTSILAIYKSPIHVPAGRFIGKSPEYIELYTHAYQRKMRRLQTKWAATGVVTGCTIPIIGCLVIRYQ